MGSAIWLQSPGSQTTTLGCLPVSTSTEGLAPDCIHIIEQVYCICHSLRDLPLENTDLEMVTVEASSWNRDNAKLCMW